MNGLLVLSLDSGLLMYSSRRLDGFGFRPSSGPRVDAMQLSATIFALYKSAAPIAIEGEDDAETGEGAGENSSDSELVSDSINVNKPAISWIEQVSRTH
jgi:hypothetical protein